MVITKQSVNRPVTSEMVSEELSPLLVGNCLKFW